MFNLGAFRGTKDVVPLQFIKTGKEWFARMDAIGKQYNPTAMRQNLINCAEHHTCILRPGGIRRVEMEAEWQTDTIGRQSNLYDTIVRVMTGLVERQVQHLVREFGD